ncbi:MULTISPECIES: hypothetical protein [Nocardia]|uniref:hypothetical protein n=1 Tax=Nocardia TaxID=1817 RepID=UPI0024538575|nr:MULTISPECIES: hypothetical protein [Nocardia]
MAKTRRRVTALAALPLVAAVGAATAHAAPGQPGLAAPGQGQPGLSTTPTPPPQPESRQAAYLPPPPPAPARPRPSRQQQPQAQTVIQPRAPRAEASPELESVPDAGGGDEQPVVETPAAPPRPDTFRFGSTTLDVPDWVDPALVSEAQEWSNWAEWWVAAGYDQIGFSKDESDRRAASTVAGAGLGGYAGAVVTTPWGALPGCMIGMAIGGVAGFALGAPTVVGAPLGATIGGIGGCMIGTAVLGLPAFALGATAGALAGAAVAGAIGGGTDIAPVPNPMDTPPPPPAVSGDPIPAPGPAPEPVVVQDQAVQVAEQVSGQIEQAAPQISAVADQLSAVHPVVEQAVTSLRDAIAGIPMLDPAQFGAVAAPVNELIGAVQTVAAA